jgi:hypothetical protein
MTRLVELIEFEKEGICIEVTIEGNFRVVKAFAHGDQLQETRRTRINRKILSTQKGE